MEYRTVTDQPQFLYPSIGEICGICGYFSLLLLGSPLFSVDNSMR
jgi:hypothetical protein